MKSKRLIFGLVAAIAVSLVVLAFQVANYMKAVEQAGKPLRPDQRFSIHPGAPTEEEIEREERKLQENYLKAERENEDRFNKAAQPRKVGSAGVSPAAPVKAPTQNQ
jgi:hypothetical protein